MTCGDTRRALASARRVLQVKNGTIAAQAAAAALAAAIYGSLAAAVIGAFQRSTACPVSVCGPPQSCRLEPAIPLFCSTQRLCTV